MEKKKKIWAEPKLTALVRRKPEEYVLKACKYDLMSGPNETEGACRVVGVQACGACSGLGQT